MRFFAFKLVLIGVVGIFLNGCSFFVSKATDDFGSNLSQAILNHNEPETIVEAIPPYLLLLETLIVNEPGNEALLSSAATLYGAYNNMLNGNANRKKLLSSKALNFALRSACVHDQTLCQLNKKKYQEFETIIQQTESDDIAALFTLGSAWALWIQSNNTDWNAIAQLAQVKLIMTRVIELDDSYKGGNAHVYLGVLATILPPALGGTPDVGKQHFESAIKLSDGKNLMVKVIYAKQYARMMFERELHDSLLNAVMSAEIDQPDLTLTNTLAKQQAKDLLDTADEYF